jgi:hypothetical protein
MKTNNEIVEEIYRDERFFKAVQNIAQPQFVDDLWMECILIMLEYDNAKLNEIYDKKQLRFYFVRIVSNQINSKTSPFYKKYKKENFKYIDANAEVSDENLLEMDEIEFDDEDLWIKYAKISGELYWYDRELFELYVKLGSYRAVSKETGIPLRSIGTNLKATREFLARRLKELDIY